MFTRCSSLKSLLLSYFITSTVTIMLEMFLGCKSLTYLHLSYFDTSSVNNIKQMFKECVNLEYINLYNFDESKITQLMWDCGPKNVVMCVKTISEDTIQTLKQDKFCLVIDCSKDWKSKKLKIINYGECTDSCDKNSQYKYEDNGKCVNLCPNDNFFNDEDDNIDKCKCALDKCLLCPQVTYDNNICSKFNINYYPKEDDPLNFGEYFNCYNGTQEGYYFNINIYKKSYKSCKTCNGLGTDEEHNCITCNDNFPIEIKIN